MLLGEYLQTVFGAANLFVCGVAMVFVILCLPDGLVGLARRRWRAARPLLTAEPPREGTVDVR
jgi:ABC-type branched-subunit amino acid transport system permease subunit